MSARLFDRNLLLVEGVDEQRVLPYLLDDFLTWGDSKDAFPVEIKPCDGIENLLSQPGISVELKAPGREVVGLLIDGNDQPAARWERVRGILDKLTPPFPASLPPTGLIHRRADGPDIGVWIMPDNQDPGMTETFLMSLASDAAPALRACTDQFVDDACAAGATVRPVHRDKARVHAWLAVQDPPGEPLGRAAMKHWFDTGHPIAKVFANWFVDLFQLRDRRHASAASD